MKKTCIRCREEKDASEFHKSKTGKHGLLAVCKQCLGVLPELPSRKLLGKENWKRWTRAWHLRNKYGMTEQEYDDLLKAQGGVCAICKTLPILTRSMPVDHDHQTGQVRGILCDPCNNGIGALRDDPAIVQSAADYLMSFLQPGSK